MLTPITMMIMVMMTNQFNVRINHHNVVDILTQLHITISLLHLLIESVSSLKIHFSTETWSPNLSHPSYESHHHHHRRYSSSRPQSKEFIPAYHSNRQFQTINDQ